MARPNVSPLIFFFFADQLRQYFTQLRQELGQRLVEKVFGNEDKPSKVLILLVQEIANTCDSYDKL